MCGVTTGSVMRLTSILLERQQQDVRSSIWLYHKAPDVPVNTMTAPSGRGRRVHITLHLPFESVYESESNSTLI